MKFLTVQQPKVPERHILDHLQRAYGLPGSLKRLERSCLWQVSITVGKVWLPGTKVRQGS